MEELYHGKGDLSMAIARYLAMTADEFAATPSTSEPIAWMACHFSPYSTSLSNLPEKLPADSLLILNDSTPPGHQDPEIVFKTLENILKEHQCFGLLLDFQRPNCPECQNIARELVKLEFPVCVAESYAKNLDCPVFLPPLPLTIPLDEYIIPWKGRDIWLDTALNREQIIITKEGSITRSIANAPDCPHRDAQLHCHYHIAIADDSITFTLWRTKEDLDDLLAEAGTLGIAVSVGLYQELK